MARGSQQANTAATSAQTLSNNYASNANSIYGSLAPQLEAEAAHPAGFSPSDLANINTAAQQSAGGSQSAAVGQGALMADRTHNQGATDAAIAASSRTAGQQLSKEAVGTQMANAQLKQKQQQAGLSGMEGLYGTSAGESVGALGQVAANVNANTNAANQSWDWAKYILDPTMSAASGAAAGAGY